MTRRGTILIFGVLMLALLLGGPLTLVATQSGASASQESAHTAAGPFLLYWEANGGQARFGAPISAELNEGGQTVQYFERAKLGRIDDGAVRLAPLGRDLHNQRYPANVFTPTPIDPSSLPGGSGAVDSATGIAIPAVFLSVWQRYGGADGFGLPVSGVFREGARLVQYFETGRLAHRPAAVGTANEVEIGAVGRLAYGRGYSEPQPPRVAASLSIIGDLARNVAGTVTPVASIVPPGAEPHEFEASPADAATVANANVLFVNGLNLEAWLDDVIENVGTPGPRMVTLSDGLPVLGRDSLNPEFEQGNPHLWLDPTLAMAYVMTMRDTLSDLDPANSPTYDANAARYLATLRDLDSAIFAEVATIPAENRKFVTFHDAWPYFTARYGISNFPVHQSTPEADISAQEYAALIDLIRRENIRVIFGEAGFNPKRLNQLARDTGVLFVENLYGDTPAPDGPFSTYVGMMQHDVSQMVDSLK